MRMLFLVLLLLFTPLVFGAQKEFVDTSEAYVDAQANTLANGRITGSFTVKQSGNYTVAFGVNKHLSLGEFEIYAPHLSAFATQYVCAGNFTTFENNVSFRCTNETDDFSHAYLSFDDEKKTAYWSEVYMEDWLVMSKNLFIRKELHDGKSDWYEAGAISLVAGVPTPYRVRVNAPYLKIGEVASSAYPDYDGKFDIAIYPSHEDGVKGASSHGTLTLLDPVVNLTDGILGWWTLDNASTSGTTMIDSAGLKNGTNNGFTQGYPGQVNQSVNTTPGTVNEVSIGDYPETGNITVLSWLNSSQWGIQTGRHWISRDGSGRVFGTFQVSDANAPMLFYILNNSNVYQECGMKKGAGYFTNNSLNHLAVSYQGNYNSTHGNISWFVNGTLVRNCTFTPATGSLKITTSDALQIGNRESSSDSWNGVIDEVGVYSRALSSDELLAIYNNNTAGRSYPFGNDVVVYPFTSLLLPASASWSWGTNAYVSWLR
jgi:hypothetical protein